MEGRSGHLEKDGSAEKLRYDLVQRDLNGGLHVYYGVSDDGIDGPWRELVGSGSPVMMRAGVLTVSDRAAGREYKKAADLPFARRW